MNGRVWGALILLLLCFAATDERAYLHSWLNQAMAAEEVANDAVEEARSKVRARGNDAALASRDFPAADLVEGEGGHEAAFRNPLALAEYLRQVTGKRQWRKQGEIEWLDRRRMLRVRQTPEVLEAIKEHLQRIRGVRQGRVRLTLRLLILPAGEEGEIRDGSASVISESERVRLESRWRGRTAGHRDHVNKHLLYDGDVLYGWTSTEMSLEDTYRGLNMVLESADDGHGVTLVPYPYEGDEGRVDWPKLMVPVGQTAMYDLPTPARDLKEPDTTRVLAFVTVDAVTVKGSR